MKRMLKPQLYLIAISLILAACTTTIEAQNNPANTATTITVYKDASCGCCGAYASYLTQNGYDVKVEVVPNTDAFKKEKGVPDDLRSCHTSIVGNYLIEGHVPIQAIKKLLAEQPPIKGIALPGMPAGSPGMGGQKQSKWQIYQIAEGTPVFTEV